MAVICRWCACTDTVGVFSRQWRTPKPTARTVGSSRKPLVRYAGFRNAQLADVNQLARVEFVNRYFADQDDRGLITSFRVN